jgi:DNA replication protein DnaC
MDEQDRRDLEQATRQWQNIREQQGYNAPKAEPQRPADALERLQEHVNQLWELGGKMRRDVEPEVACETCKGARYVAVRDAFPPRTVACPDCFDAWYAAKIRRSWPLTEQEILLGGKQWVRRADAPQMNDAARRVSLYADSVIAGEADMLAINGPVGIGKTHLMLRLYAKVSAANLAVIYRTATTIQRHLQNFGYDPESRREADRRREMALSALTRVPLLILDEAEKATGDWFENQMLDILNARRNARLATALAGNALSQLPAPVLSRARAAGCVFLSLDGVPDARPVLDGA